MKDRNDFWKLLLILFSNDGSFSLGVFVVFMIAHGLSLSQISVVIAVYCLSVSIGALPGGIIADRFSYKKALLCGGLLFLVGTVIFASSQNFYWFLVGYTLIGIGSALKQGSIYAQLYESLKAYGEEQEFKKMAGRLELYMNLFWVFAIIVGGLLYSITSRLPFFAEAVLAVISLIATLMIKELKTAKSETSVFSQMKDSVMYAFGTVNFSKIFIFSAFIGSIAIITFQYTQPLYKSLNIPTIYFGFIAAAFYLIRGLGAWYSDKLGKIFSVDHYLVLHATVFGMFLVFLQRAGNIFFIFLILAVLYLLRGLYSPTLNTYINDKVPTEKRATTLSLNNQLLTLSSAAGMFITGMVSDRFGLPSVFFILSIFSSTFLIFYVLFLRKVQID